MKPEKIDYALGVKELEKEEPVLPLQPPIPQEQITRRSSYAGLIFASPPDIT